VNKAELIDELSTRFGGNKRAAGHALESVLDTITRAVVKGEKVAITGFGVFERAQRKARTARNPATGESVRVKATTVPRFKAGQAFKGFVSGATKLPRLVIQAPPATAPAAPARTATKSATRKTTAKKATTRKSAAKKAPARKAAKATRPAAKRTATSKTTARPAARKTATKKTTAKKTVATRTAKKATTGKAAAKKAPARRAAKKTTGR
jgi:DNA-binding protein HU-beta